MSDGIPEFQSSKVASAEEHNGAGIGHWLAENLAKPAANAAVIEPYNAVANVLNVGPLPDWAPKLKEYELAPAKLGSPAWFSQTASSGLAALGPYTIAGKFAGGAMRAGGAKFEVEGALASLLKNQQVSMVAGAAAFDFARDTHPGETRAFNALAGAGAFSIFGLGNHMSRGLSLGYRLPALAATGMVGGSAQHFIARVPSGEMPGKEELINSAASGGFMNVFLPHAQTAMARTAFKVNNSLGRGNLHDQYAAEKFSGDSGNDQLQQNHTDLAAAASPWLRVVETNNDTSYRGGSNRIYLGKDDRSLDKLVHELDHHVKDDRTLSYEPNFLLAKQSLLQGDEQRAREIFQNTRWQQERSAMQAAGQEIPANQDLARLPVSTDKYVSTAKSLGTNKTYADVWHADFEKFKQSGGDYRPEQQFASRQTPIRYDKAQLEDMAQRFTTLGREQKLDFLAGLGKSLSPNQAEALQQAMNDPSYYIKSEAAAKLGSLPPALRMDSFHKMVESADHRTRLLALHNVDSLPAKERPRIFQNLINGSARHLLKPLTPNQRLEQDLINEFDMPKKTNSLLNSDPAEILLSKLDSVQASKRTPLLEAALQDEGLRLIANANIHRLPVHDQAQVWQKAWAAHNNDNAWRWRDRDTNAAADLLAGISKLSPLAVEDSLHSVLNRNDRLDGKALATAIKALPEDQRAPYWEQLYRSTVAVDRGLAGALEALPEALRTEAWWKTAGLLKPVTPEKFYAGKPDYLPESARQFGYLLDSIECLPPSDRIAAMERVCDGLSKPLWREAFADYRSSNSTTALTQFQEAFKRIPTGDLPALMKAVLRIDRTNGRESAIQALRFLPLGLSNLPVNDRLNILQDFYGAAAENARSADYAALKRSLSYIPEAKPTSAESELDILPTPVRDALIDRLEPAFLLSSMMDGALPPDMVQFAQRHPQAIRELAKQVDDWDYSDAEKMHGRELIGRIAASSNNNERLQELARIAVTAPAVEHSSYLGDFSTGGSALTLISELAKSAPFSERLDTCRDLTELATRAPDKQSMEMAIHLAAKLSEQEPQLYAEIFTPRINSFLADSSADFSKRLTAVRAISSLERDGVVEPGKFDLPGLRMPKDKEIDPQAALQLQSQLISALRTGKGIEKLLGDGALGRTFPELFGHYETTGGIVSRPQHDGHELPVDDHILLVVKNMRENPRFAQLTPRQQEELLLAGLMHDVGKRAYMQDPDHEMASAAMTFGVLSTLGYDPVQVSRVANLVARHSELGYWPNNLTSARLADSAHLDDIATHYKRDVNADQLRIFNESDSRSLDSRGSHYTDPVGRELDNVQSLLSGRVAELNRNSIPLLTSALPGRAGIYPVSGRFAFLTHASPELEGAFLRHLGSIQSPEYSISTSLQTNDHLRSCYQNQDQLLALISGPPEHISQAYRANLGTGVSVDWKRHVRLTSEWENDRNAKEFALEINNKLSKLGFANNGGNLGRLAELRRALQDFTSLDDIANTLGDEHKLTKGAWTLVDALTHELDGAPLERHNEVKMHNPTVSGFAVIRNGLPIRFQNAEPNSLPALFKNDLRPHWLTLDQNSKGAVTEIPELLWKSAVDQDLPFVVLDP